MRLCLISVEIFAWGKHGGFGKATRTIGREMARRGHEVLAIVPRRPGQGPEEDLDGIRVLSFDRWRPWEASALAERADADVYHSCEPSTATWLALRAMPGRKHVATFRDPRDLRDWVLELARPSLSSAQVIHNLLFENNPMVRRSIRRLDEVLSTSPHLVPKIRRMYGLSRDPRFLPTPVAVPRDVAKAFVPTVCWVARLDRRKRPELFFDLARLFPAVRFVVAGKSRDPRYGRKIEAMGRALPNVRWEGFVDALEGDRHSHLLGESWILVNCATREALPNSFLEAAAHGCAILSSVDPGGFVSRFGYHVRNDDFAKGLAALLEGGAWREKGSAARAHVAETFELSRAMDLHEQMYARLLSSR
jgi:glycosyltransferase involved in cell wall biosynthesis